MNCNYYFQKPVMQLLASQEQYFLLQLSDRRQRQQIYSESTAKQEMFTITFIAQVICSKVAGKNAKIWASKKNSLVVYLILITTVGNSVHILSVFVGLLYNHFH
jgi:hypothetical protein